MMRKTANRAFTVLTAAAVCSGAWAANITGIDTVDKLVEALKNNKGSYNYIYLAPGVYDVSGISMPKYASDGVESDSCSNLSGYKVNICGTTGNPRDTVIYNSKGDNRIVYFTYGRLEHLTISNGWAKTGNDSGHGGGVKTMNASTICSNVIVTCCRADGEGGGVYGGTWNYCRMTQNTASSHGGGAAGPTRADTGVQLDNCRVFGNVSGGNGGGVYFGRAKGGTVSSNNTANVLGGGLYTVEARDAEVVFNRLMNTAASYGAGMYGGSASNCVIAGNAIVKGQSGARRGGGVFNTACTNCMIFANVVCEGEGAGVAGSNCTLDGCVISNNVPVPPTAEWGSGTGVYGVKYLRNCDVSGMSLAPGCPMYGCRVQGYTNAYYLAAGENVHTSGWFKGLSMLVDGKLAATNCLFAGNRMQSVFACGKEWVFDLMNCTVAGNHASFTFTGFTEQYAVANVANTILSGNMKERDNSALDMCISGSDDNRFVFSNCLIGPVRNEMEPAVVETGTVVSSSPGFNVDDAADPYSLLRSSPARKKGQVMDWMADACDIRGMTEFPRTVSGYVDIGCYQYWWRSYGTVFSVR